MSRTRGLLREALPMRAVLVAVVAIIVVVMTPIAREQPGRLVFGLGVLPAFAAMLGAALGQGQHAAWSWALARPISRRRWFVAHAGLDGATLILSHQIAWWAFPPTYPPNVSLPSAGHLEDLALPLSVMAYCCTALGTATGRNAVRGLLSQVAGPLCVVAAGFLSPIAWDLVADSWLHTASFGWLKATLPLYAWLLTPITIASATAACVHALITTAPRLPGRPPRLTRIWLGWLAPLVLIPGVALVWAIPSANPIGRRGDASIHVVSPRPGVWQLDRAVEGLSSYSRRIVNLDAFDDVAAGDYRLCQHTHLQRPAVPGGIEAPYRASLCRDITITEGESITVDLTDEIAQLEAKSLAR